MTRRDRDPIKRVERIAIFLFLPFRLIGIKVDVALALLLLYFVLPFSPAAAAATTITAPLSMDSRPRNGRARDKGLPSTKERLVGRSLLLFAETLQGKGSPKRKKMKRGGKNAHALVNDEHPN